MTQQPYTMIKEDESFEEYADRISSLKYELQITWQEIANLVNKVTGWELSADAYRKRYAKNKVDTYTQLETEDEYILRIKKEKMKLSDERVQNNALIRRMAREETLIEIAREVSKTIQPYEFEKEPLIIEGEKEAILELSDWHFGIEVDSTWNKYNPEIAYKRLHTLYEKVVNILKKESIKKIHIVNLGDLISGRIHAQLRINNRFDVVTQIFRVTEMLSNFIFMLSDICEVEYYDTLDNHSRLEPKKKDALELETLARVPKWAFKNFIFNNCERVTIHDNCYADDMVTFNILGYNIAGVHGDKDLPSKVVDNLSLMTKTHYDLILTAHLHHFSCDEKNDTVVVSNGCLMGTDDFAEKLRLNSKPSQNLIIVSKDSVVESIHRIIV